MDNIPINPKIRLSKVTIDGYRSCQNTQLPLNPEITALIGINGAGKTNALNAIKLLGNRNHRVVHQSTEDVTLNETTITAWFDIAEKRIGYRSHMQLSISSRNADEIVSMHDEWNFQSITKSKAWKSIPRSLFFKKEMNRRLRNAKTPREHEMLLKQFERYEYDFFQNSKQRSATLANDLFLEDDAVEAYVEEIEQFCRRIKYYSASQFTDPTRCPSSFEVESDDRLVESYGSSRIHSKFLHDLYLLKKANPDLYSVYEDLISRNELGLISKLSWKEVQLSSYVAEVKSGGEVKRVRKYKTLIIPKVQIGQSHITFNQLSEGTFKTLALLFYIMTDDSSCIIIEEPEVCIHIGLLSRIIATIKAYSKTKQVILSTHSDQILDQIESANVVIVEMTKAGTITSEMNKWLGPKGRQALTSYLEESGTLGEYWRSGGLAQ